MAKQKVPAIKKTTKKKPATRKKAGRPPINEPTDVEAIQAKIDAYFAGLFNSDGDPKYATFSGLTRALGYHSRMSLWEASRLTGGISIPIKEAMMRIEEQAEESVYGRNPAGPIFILKNRGWRDIPESESPVDNRLTIDFTE